MDPIALRYDIAWSSDPDELSRKLAELIALRNGLMRLGVLTNVVATRDKPRSSLQAQLPAGSVVYALGLFRRLGLRNADLWLTCADAATIAATANALSWDDDATGCGAVAAVPGL